MRTAFVVSLAAALFCAAGCAGITVQANAAPGVDLARYHTFAWYTPAGAAAAGAHPLSLLDEEVRSTLTNDLAARGIIPASAAPPDFLVDYHVSEREELKDLGPAWGGGITTYVQGTLVVKFIDGRSNAVFFRGTASSIVENPDNPNPQKIADGVSRIMSRYPSTVAAAPRPAG